MNYIAIIYDSPEPNWTYASFMTLEEYEDYKALQLGSYAMNPYALHQWR